MGYWGTKPSHGGSPGQLVKFEILTTRALRLESQFKQVIRVDTVFNKQAMILSNAS